MKINSIEAMTERYGLSNSAAKRLLRRNSNKEQQLPQRGKPVPQTGKRKVRKTT